MTWNQATRQAQVDRQGDRMIFTIDGDIVTVNGIAQTLPVPAQLVGGRTLVPLRFLVEALGFAVTWDGPTRTVEILTGE